MEPRQPASFSSPVAAGARVLLVDDEINVLRSLKRVLREEHYQLFTALSGPEGLEILAREPIELIVSDQRMVPMSGIEFLREARKIRPAAIRILLTGFAEISVAERAINEVEIYRFLYKPWNDADLRTTIRQGLEKCRLEAENRRLFETIQAQNEELRRWNEKLEEMVEARTRELKEAQAQLIQSEKTASLGILAGGVAHEINNPIGGILAITQLLLSEQQNNPQLRQDLQMIEQAALHCSTIVKNLLAFARKSDPALRETVELPALLSRVLFLIGHLFRQKDIAVLTHIAPDFPALRVNPHQFQQVFLNLLINAQQAMSRKGTVTISARRGEGGVVLEVEDQGPGIPVEIQDKIFDPFFTTKEEGEGTGLGLSMVYRIVEEHGGRIELVSGAGTGACFRLVFPAEIIAPDEKEGRETRKPDEMSGLIQLNAEGGSR